MFNLFASTTEAAHTPGLFEALGINVSLLIQQGVAFLILVAILAKFVYPVLIKSIDSRRETIEAGLKEAQASKEALDDAEARVEELIKEARKEADAVIKRGQEEAVAAVADAEAKAKQRAERLIKDAHTQLEADIKSARRALKSETIKLVASATEHIISEKLDAQKDSLLIEKALAKESA